MPFPAMPRTPVPVYSLAERDRRWDLARGFMEREGLDALVVFGEGDAGPAPLAFDSRFTNDRPGVLLVFPRDRTPTALVPIPTFLFDHREAAHRGEDLWLAANDLRLGRQSHQLVQVLQDLGLSNGSVGVIGLDPYLPAHPEGRIPYPFWDTVLTLLPRVDFRGVGHAFARLMMPLGDEEVAVVRHAARIGDAMAAAMVATAAPGISEAHVFAAAMATAYRHGSLAPHLHFCSGPAPSASGQPTWGYRPQAPRILQEGDLIATEIFSTFGGRQTQHQAAIAIGEVHPMIEHAARIANACYTAGLATLRAGATFGDVSEAMLAPAEAVGAWFRGPQIHGLNPYGAFSRIPGGPIQADGGDRYPTAAPRPATLAGMTLEPGMSFAFEPSCGIGDHMVTIGGTVLVGEDGPVELSPLTARLLRAA
ncbi:M24 family metallopeptidase [Streptomyces sp. CBMA123]|uniref:M24 family metallopeptidase n=1 Tax=Streptomyces sp. CBMA123 TaxID=1896313 RepID=UPI0016620828|nr:M24 family metallopeptidase [Streptomyces sp. CBMA123]